MADEDGLAAPFDDDLNLNYQILKLKDGCEEENCTFLPSGMAARSISTLACASTSADAAMLTRKSARGCVVSH